MKSRRLIIATSVLAIIAALLFVGCSEQKDLRETEKEDSPMVEAPAADQQRQDQDAMPSLYSRTLPAKQPQPMPHRAPGSHPTSSSVRYAKNWADITEKSDIEALAINADEVWIIVKPEASMVPDQDTSGCGMLKADMPDQKDVPVPLKHTDVQAGISGYIATVEVTQQFHNPFDTKIEATYVFPLPQNAAVHDFLMTVGERTIRGIIRERQEAEEIYQQARAQGHVASLLTQERPNIFTQKVANIEPGKEIDVNIKYFNTLAYDDGWFEFVFPMVVGPRYNPAGTTDGVGAVGRGQTGRSGQATEVTYLAPNERSGHDINLTCQIDAGVAIEEIECRSHVVRTDRRTQSKASIQLSDLDRIPNKDFVLRYRVAGDRIKSNIITHRDERGSYFTLMVYPPAELKHLQRAPMEMIFVLDCSGSMQGYPMDQAKKAIKRALMQLQTNDTFQIIRFSNNASQLGPNPIPVTRKNIQKALDYVDRLHGSGGTEMIEGVKAALNFEHDPERLRLVSFMTDGYIGNENQILTAIHAHLGESRIFSFGIGSSVNRYLLDRMAQMGKGAVAYIGLNDDPTDAIDRFYQRISHPALTNVTIDYGRLQAQETFPQMLPDLFVGRPLLVTGRLQGNGNTNIHITGKAGGKAHSITVPVSLDRSEQHPAIASLWARKKIEQLSLYPASDTQNAITNTALAYNLMSAYTAFIAVDSSTRTQGDHGISVAVPVPVPEGVRYDTTVQN